MFYSSQSTASQRQNRMCFSVTEVMVNVNTSLLTNFICDTQPLHGAINLIQCFITVFVLSGEFGEKLFCSVLRKFLVFFCNKQIHWFAAWPMHLCPRCRILRSINCQLCSRVFSFFKNMLSVQLLCSLFPQNI